jgi:hypothetical protein
MLYENVRLVMHDAGVFVTTIRLTKVLLGLNVPPTRSTDAQPTPDCSGRIGTGLLQQVANWQSTE